MTTDWKALCAELLAHAQTAQAVAVGEGLWDGSEDDGLITRARAALSQPEPHADGEVAELGPAGPADEQLMAAARAAVETYPRVSELPYFMEPDSSEYEPMLLALRAAAALGRPTPQPIPVSQWLPGAAEADGRDPECVQRWPECEDGAYDPRCCRFPKSCSCGPR